MIKELDPEISFIDSIFIKINTIDNKEIILSPSNYKLRFRDGNYLKLRQGEHIEIKFQLPKGVKAQKYTLTARGYYIPAKPE